MSIIEKILRVVISFLFRIEAVGEENAPDEGAYVACINHISVFDPIVVGYVSKRRIRFIAKEEVFRIPVVGWYLKSINVIPIKRGSADIGAIKESLRTLKSGEILGIFPTGTRERKNPNASVKSGAALIALKADAPVIPIHINASYKLFSRVRISYGEAVDLSQYRGRKLSQEELSEASELIYSHIKALGDVK
jgi:1-acyl-sn-glycerol-3-phosphate acyltransferase